MIHFALHSDVTHLTDMYKCGGFKAPHTVLLGDPCCSWVWLNSCSLQTSGTPLCCRSSPIPCLSIWVLASRGTRSQLFFDGSGTVCLHMRLVSDPCRLQAFPHSDIFPTFPSVSLQGISCSLDQFFGGSKAPGSSRPLHGLIPLVPHTLGAPLPPSFAAIGVKP